MTQHAANSAADSSDPLANAVTSPQASLFIRQILQAALQNPAGAPPIRMADAQALLANVLMNDYLNGWNAADQNERQKQLVDARSAVQQAGNSAQAYHAQGLINRADRQHNAARKAFREAKCLDAGFARGHAQFGNQKVFLGREQEAHAPLDRARQLSPHHPASGYFYWADGRAYFQETIWSNAIYWLTKSVTALPTVWYTWCYLAAAQNNAADAATQATANKTMNDFINTLGRGTLDQAVASLQPRAGDQPTVAEARQTVLQFIQNF
jgi:tetratricopeptide (TPR) repeat protein